MYENLFATFVYYTFRRCSYTICTVHRSSEPHGGNLSHCVFTLKQIDLARPAILRIGLRGNSSRSISSHDGSPHNFVEPRSFRTPAITSMFLSLTIPTTQDGRTNYPHLTTCPTPPRRCTAMCLDAVSLSRPLRSGRIMTTQRIPDQICPYMPWKCRARLIG